jgi:hypothetical protein
VAKQKKEETLELRWLRLHVSELDDPKGPSLLSVIPCGPFHYLVLQYTQGSEWKDVPIAFG